MEKMINLTINGIAVSVPENTTILEAARLSGVEIPTLCFMKEKNEIGACRICVVGQWPYSYLLCIPGCGGHGCPYKQRPDPEGQKDDSGTDAFHTSQRVPFLRTFHKLRAAEAL